MRRFFINLKLTNKLYFCIIVLILVPFLGASIAYDRVFSQELRKNDTEVALNVLLQSKRSIEYIISEIDSLSQTLLYEDSIQMLYKRLQADKDKRSSEVDMNVERRNLYYFLTPLFFNKQYVDSVSVTSNGVELFKYGEVVSKEDEVLMSLALETHGKANWIPAHQLKNTIRNDDNYYISMVRGISDKAHYKKMIAVERISFNETMLNSFYQSMNVYEGGNIYIVDKNGYLVSSSDKSVLGTKWDSTQGLIPQINAAKEQGYFINLEDGTDRTALYYKIDAPEWIVIQMVPNRELDLQRPVITLVVSSILFCFGSFVLIYSMIIKKTIIAPIKSITQDMEQVSQGELDVQIHYESKDEIGDLSYLFVRMTKRLQHLINTIYLNQISLKNAELKFMSSQINPHFLYNTLDSIHWLAVKNKDYDVSEQLEALSDLFRHVLNNGQEETTIAEELEGLQNYLYLQKIRMQDKISVKIEVDPQLMPCKVLKLLLQPLIENSINHGLECKVNGGTIFLTIKKVEDTIRIIVEDDGLGTDEKVVHRALEDSQESFDVFALKNIQSRIKLKYGEQYQLLFNSEIGLGTKVELSIPYNTPDS